MKKEEIQKKIVLGLLFVFPIVVYLFFASGKNNFAKLPILTNEVNELSSLASVTDDSIKSFLFLLKKILWLNFTH